MKARKNIYTLLFCIITLVFMLSGCTPTSSNSNSLPTSTNKQTAKSSNEIKVHYIDVGQGDSILVQVNNKNMLIDAGTNENHSELISYLKSLNIKKLDYFITTHPHEDHIGGASYVINSFDIGEFYAPKKIYGTKTYKKMINSLNKKGYKIHVAKEGISLNLGGHVVCEMLSPNRKDYEEINNYSPIIKLVYKNNKFLFTGDAETLVEKDVLSKNYDLSSDVLKLGHHGSVSSTSSNFLNTVNPKIAIVSCGKNNKYGHPHKETLSKLKKINCRVYRTDINGSIIINGNGNTLKVNTTKN